jgi:predicted RNase H-like nuclease
MAIAFFLIWLLFALRIHVLKNADKKAFSHINALINTNLKQADKCLSTIDLTIVGLANQLLDLTKWTPKQFYPWLEE